MRKARTLPFAFPLITLALCLLGSLFSGCGEEDGCDVGGKHYAVGESFACDCNHCVCEADGKVSSTLIECNAGAPGK